MKPEPISELRVEKEAIRKKFLRANTLAGLIMAAVLLLAVAAILQSARALRNQRRAERAEQAGRERLFHSYLAQAHGERLSGQAGQRTASLKALASAAEIHPSTLLRNDAIAALSLADIEKDQEGWPLPTNTWIH